MPRPRRRLFIAWRQVLTRPASLEVVGAVEVGVSRDEAWTVLSDPEFEHRVSPQLRAAGFACDAPGGSGTVYFFVADTPDGPRGSLAVREVVRPGVELRWDNISSDFANGWTLVLSDLPAAHGCRVEHTYWMTIPRGLPIGLREPNRRSLEAAARRFADVVRDVCGSSQR